VVTPPQPPLERGHRHRRIIVQQRDERLDVIALEGVDVAVEELLVRLVARLQ